MIIKKEDEVDDYEYKLLNMSREEVEVRANGTEEDWLEYCSKQLSTRIDDNIDVFKRLADK